MKFIFNLQINIKAFFKLILSFKVSVTRHVQVALNNKFLMSSQYLKKEVKDKVDILHANKHQSFLQVDFNTEHKSFLHDDTIVIDGYDQAFSKYSKSCRGSYKITAFCLFVLMTVCPSVWIFSRNGSLVFLFFARC